MGNWVSDAEGSKSKYNFDKIKIEITAQSLKTQESRKLDKILQLEVVITFFSYHIFLRQKLISKISGFRSQWSFCIRSGDSYFMIWATATTTKKENAWGRVGSSTNFETKFGRRRRRRRRWRRRRRFQIRPQLQRQRQRHDNVFRSFQAAGASRLNFDLHRERKKATNPFFQPVVLKFMNGRLKKIVKNFGFLSF